MELDKKVVVITGGSGGFGRALAESFISEGATVAIIADKEEKLERVASDIGAYAYVADVRKEEDVQNTVISIISDLGGIDVWINNAGVFYVFPDDQSVDMNRAHEMFDINFFGAVFGSRSAISHMNAAGAVINLLSSAALDASRAKNGEMYVASKWALRGYTEWLRARYADSGLSIYSVYPSGMKTDLHHEAPHPDMDNFMEPRDVAMKVITNLKMENPELELVIKRPTT